MRSVVLMAALIAASALPAMSDQHDSRIDEAAARIVAGKIGGLRGGFGPGVEPVFVESGSEPPTGAIRRASSVDRGVRSDPGGWNRGLARAHEPRGYEPVAN